MALIPPDAGIRMRMQTEASLHPVLPVAGIPSDLPDLQPGQVFSARIQEVLPEATYKALVAGKQLTLSLPEGAKAGDTLELLVVDRGEHVITARLAQPTTANPQAYAHTTLSPAAQLIGRLLTSEGDAPQPAPLNRGQPLLPQAPMHGQELAPALEKAVANSGLFYEAHQAQWVAGRLPVTQLLQEPQGRHSNPAAAHASAASTAGIAAPPAQAGAGTEATRAALAAPANSAGEAAEAASARVTTTSTNIPEDLRPLVQQQLDAVATQRLAWHGEVWPGQVMEWEIERDKPQTSSSGEEAPEQWATSLRLTTPRLGSVHATIRLTASGVGMVIATPHGASAADLRDELPALAQSLEAAGVPPLLLQVQHEAETRGEAENRGE